VATGKLGHSTLIKDLVRDFQKRSLCLTVEGTPDQRLRHAHTIATNSRNAETLRNIAAIGTDCSLDVDGKIKQIRAMVADTLQPLGLKQYVQAHEIEELMLALQKLLSAPDFDVVYSGVTDQVLNILDGALENFAAGACPTATDPLDHLRRRVRLIIVKLRHDGLTVDAACDKINIAIGWQCCALGLPEDAVPNLTRTINRICTLLERTQGQFDPIT